MRYLLESHATSEFARCATQAADDQGTLNTGIQVLLRDGPNKQILGPLRERIAMFFSGIIRRWVTSPTAVADRWNHETQDSEYGEAEACKGNNVEAVEHPGEPGRVNRSARLPEEATGRICQRQGAAQ